MDNEMTRYLEKQFYFVSGSLIPMLFQKKVYSPARGDEIRVDENSFTVTVKGKTKEFPYDDSKSPGSYALEIANDLHNL